MLHAAVQVFDFAARQAGPPVGKVHDEGIGVFGDAVAAMFRHGVIGLETLEGRHGIFSVLGDSLVVAATESGGLRFAFPTYARFKTLRDNDKHAITTKGHRGVKNA